MYIFIIIKKVYNNIRIEKFLLDKNNIHKLYRFKVCRFWDTVIARVKHKTFPHFSRAYVLVQKL